MFEIRSTHEEADLLSCRMKRAVDRHLMTVAYDVEPTELFLLNTIRAV